MSIEFLLVRSKFGGGVSTCPRPQWRRAISITRKSWKTLGTRRSRPKKSFQCSNLWSWPLPGPCRTGRAPLFRNWKPARRSWLPLMGTAFGASSNILMVIDKLHYYSGLIPCRCWLSVGQRVCQSTPPLGSVGIARFFQLRLEAIDLPQFFNRLF